MIICILVEKPVIPKGYESVTAAILIGLFNGISSPLPLYSYASIVWPTALEFNNWPSTRFESYYVITLLITIPAGLFISLSESIDTPVCSAKA